MPEKSLFRFFQFFVFQLLPYEQLNETSSGARAMHGFGAEVFIEEVRKCNDMMIYSTGVSFLAGRLRPVVQFSPLHHVRGVNS